ncbi:hypothetical protein J2S10_005189 [Neobacillus ginsengisoli]|uniref:Uncharacterized protein n=1 Tax=Neobacillus ginsengisoli TaxID=904295 RepID=A0ABT9Y2E9_9BACI|nr:hypothetical protein [Neobacillus ginsengisoli]
MINRIKKFSIVLVAFIITISILYVIGMKFNMPLLVFHHRYKDYSTGSLLPYLIAVVVSIFVVRRVNSKIVNDCT